MRSLLFFCLTAIQSRLGQAIGTITNTLVVVVPAITNNHVLVSRVVHPVQNLLGLSIDSITHQRNTIEFTSDILEGDLTLSTIEDLGLGRRGLAAHPINSTL